MSADGVYYKVNDRAVRDAFALALARQDEALHGAIVRAAEVVRAEAEHKAPKGHPHRSRGKTLAASIYTRVLANAAVIRSSKRYASIQEFGGTTGPHTISAKKKKALSFNGMVVKSVKHPGGRISAKHYMFGAVEAKRREVDKIVERAIDDSVRSLIT